MNEKPTRDRSVGFTDASYIRQDDAPNMPRCYSFSEEKSSGTKKTVSPLRVGALCLAFFVLGSLLTTAFSDAENPVVNTKTAVPTPSSETVQTGDLRGGPCRYAPLRNERAHRRAPLSRRDRSDRELRRGGVL